MKKQIKDERTFSFDDEIGEFEEKVMNQIYIDPISIAEGNDKKINDKYRFEADFYTIHKILEHLKKSPPKGSYFETEWKESEGSSGIIPYAAIHFMYNSKLKIHSEYAKKIEKLICTKTFEKSCRKDFEIEFKKFVNNKYRNIYKF